MKNTSSPSKVGENWTCQHIFPDSLSIDEQQRRFSSRSAKLSLRNKTFSCSKCSVKAPDVWACLHCDFLGCGRTSQQHMLDHFNSTLHPVCINVSSKMIWCYECDEELLEETCANAKETRMVESIRELLSATTPRRQSRSPTSTSPSSSSLARPRGKSNYLPGTCGLYNMGNTCYMNAALQCLSNITPLRDFFMEFGSELAIGKSPAGRRLAADFSALISQMWSGQRKAVKPSSVVYDIKRANPVFRGYAQQDSQEFIRSILDLLDEGLKCLVPVNASKSGNRSKKEHPSDSVHQDVSSGSMRYRSIISDLFMGHLVSKLTCLSCGNVSRKEEPFFDLSVSIPDQSTIDALMENYDESTIPGGGQSSGFMSRMASWLGLVTRSVDIRSCLAAFCMTETLRGSERYHCEKCKKLTRCEKQFSLGRSPDVLCITIKRFKYDSYFGSKMQEHIDFPLRGLDMSPFYDDSLGRVSNGDDDADDGGVQNEDRDDKVVVDGHKQETMYSSPENGSLYDLMAVVNHIGSLNGGHYVGYALNEPSGNWYEFDDSYVSKCSKEKVRGIQAYVLFYARRDGGAAAHREYVQKLIDDGGGKCGVYIDRCWFARWRSASNPGRIPCTDVCVHGRLHVAKGKDEEKSPRGGGGGGGGGGVKSRYVLVPQSAWEELFRVHGSGPRLTKLEACDVCLEEEKALDRARKEQKKCVTERDRRYLKTGEKWRLVHALWLKKWHLFIGGGPRPGPITNDTLLDEKGEPKVGLEPVKNYRGIVPKTWEYLHEVYGGGPSITCKAIDIYHSSLLIE